MPRSQNLEFVRRLEWVVLVFALLWRGLTVSAQTNSFPALVCSNRTNIEAKSKLGPPQTIHVIAVINSLEVKIESSGKYSTAYINNLPGEVIRYVQSIQTS